MGLDVYLEEHAEKMRRDAINEAKESGEKWEYRPEVPSQKYPDHLFKRTYLRSSYNEGGFNQVAGNIIGRGLHHIFEEQGDEYDRVWSKSELEAARERALTVLADLRSVDRPLNAYAIPLYNMFAKDEGLERIKGIDAVEAIHIVQEERRKYEKQKAKDPEHTKLFGGSYSNREGHFYLDEPLKVVAAIPGQRFNVPSVWLVYDDDLTWYITAAEIVVEFIDEALSYKAPVITWSG